MAANNPTSRFDTNERLKADYRTPYVVGMIERARRAGVPDSALAYEDAAGDNWYSELVIRSSLIARGQDPEGLTGWPRVQQLEDYAGMIRIGLGDLGITESARTGQLVPKLAGLHDLIMRHREHSEFCG